VKFQSNASRRWRSAVTVARSAPATSD
jgi:hypothetical protein